MLQMLLLKGPSLSMVVVDDVLADLQELVRITDQCRVAMVAGRKGAISVDGSS